MASILVVEDDPTIRDVMVYQLKAAGHDLHTADNGVDAVDQFRVGMTTPFGPTVMV